MICLQVVLVILFSKKMPLHLFASEAEDGGCQSRKNYRRWRFRRIKCKIIGKNHCEFENDA